MKEAKKHDRAMVMEINDQKSGFIREKEKIEEEEEFMIDEEDLEMLIEDMSIEDNVEETESDKEMVAKFTS